MECFLRRISQADHIKKGALHRRAFKCRSEEPSLSFTRVTPELAQRNFESYYEAGWLPSGDKPALCYLREDQFSAGSGAPVPDPVSDQPFGELHCSASCPRDDVVAENLAYHATQNGMIRPLLSLRKGVVAWDPPQVAPPFQAWTV